MRGGENAVSVVVDVIRALGERIKDNKEFSVKEELKKLKKT